jgi:hypothetical protein
MKNKQLISRIGNIDDILIEEALNASSFQRPALKRSITKILLVAAVIVLMVGSFAAGALAMRNSTLFDWTDDEAAKIEGMGLTTDEVSRLFQVNLSEAAIAASTEGSEAVRTITVLTEDGTVVLTEDGDEYEMFQIHIPSALAEGLLTGKTLYFVVEDGELVEISLTD